MDYFTLIDYVLTYVDISDQVWKFPIACEEVSMWWPVHIEKKIGIQNKNDQSKNKQKYQENRLASPFPLSNSLNGAQQEKFGNYAWTNQWSAALQHLSPKSANVWKKEILICLIARDFDLLIQKKSPNVKTGTIVAFLQF